jgi:hypothetical protein
MTIDQLLDSRCRNGDGKVSPRDLAAFFLAEGEGLLSAEDADQWAGRYLYFARNTYDTDQLRRLLVGIVRDIHIPDRLAFSLKMIATQQ